ncbi:alpha/beta fold hydrolase [Jatrophihabitans fulvus]
MVDLAHDVRGTGPLLVLVHGITEDRRSWDPLTNDLAKDHRVLRVDLRGHGESPAGDGYTAADYAADIAPLVDEPPLVVGHSLGGLVATAYAAAFETRGAINVDQSLHLAGFRDAARAVEPALRSDAFGDVMRAMFEGFRGPLDDAEWQRLSDLRSPRQDVVLGTWQLLFDLDVDDIEAQMAALLRGVKVPYLNLLGSWPPGGYPEWLLDLAPRSRVEVWEGLGHYPHLAEPERFLTRVREFEEDL